MSQPTPGETTDSELLASLADDFARSLRAGENPSVEQYAQKHPSLADQIRELFPALLVIEKSSIDPTVSVAPATERLGALIGRYKLLERIGEGGFGSVFMAEQLAPVRRKVALKLIKPGLDTRQVIARFENERQALALMDHQNIAKVLDGGATESGRPYFVMELVHGVPITDYCDKNHLPPRQRLELFIQVCRAVQHAHTKGIIHRDIKPTNVLVTMHDGVAVPKVIDFGVAKAIGEQLTEKTLFTNFAQMIGTPLYMSPEQAEMSGIDVDTRSDVYALGVLLYELLTGTTPFDKTRLKQAAFDEVRRIIRDEEPPKPSTRLSTTDELPSIAANRGLEPKKLSGLVRGELDWIVMRALEKDRTRRYETANGFARDIERYLHNEPVEACPPSARYRMSKFIRRHKRTLATATVLLVALVVTVIAQAINYRAIRREQAKTLSALRDAENGRRRAREALDELSSDIIGDWLTRQATLTDKQKEVLEHAMRRYEQFAAEAGAAPADRVAMARACWRIADMRAQLGMRPESDAAYARGIEVYRSLAAQFPDEPKYLSEMAKMHVNQSASLQRAGAWGASLTSCEAACAVLEPLTARYPDAPEYAIDLAGAYCNMAHLRSRDNDAAGALIWYDRAITRLEPFRQRRERELGYARMFLSNALCGRAGALEDLGRLEEAFTAHEAARALREQMVAQFDDPQYARELGASFKELAALHAKLKRPEQALKAFDAAIAVLGALVNDHPAVPQFIDDLAGTHMSQGELQIELGRLADARGSFEATRDLRERAVRANPGSKGHAINLGGAHCNVGNAIKATGEVQASLASYQKAIDTLSPLAQTESPPGRARRFLRNGYSGRADAMLKLRRYGEALDDIDHAITLDDSRNPSYRVRRAAVLVNLGRHADAFAATDELAAALNDLPSGVAYDAACVNSLCAAAVIKDAQLSAAERDRLVEEYESRAIILLRRAIQAGFTDAAHLSSDPDLDPLRQREDFKNLMANLKATTQESAVPNRQPSTQPSTSHQ